MRMGFAITSNVRRIIVQRTARMEDGPPACQRHGAFSLGLWNGAAEAESPGPLSGWKPDLRPAHGAAVTFTRMKRGGEVPMRKLSRTLSVVALFVITVVVAALKESGWPVSNVPALCTS